MPFTEEELAQLDQLLGPSPQAPAQAQPLPLPGTLPPEIAGVAYPVSFTKGGLRVNIPPPASETQRQLRKKEEEARITEESATRRQLLKKATDQKLQLEQAIGLFEKIYNEAESDIPVIQRPEGTLTLQQLSRFAWRKLGLREQRRGTIESLQARATPALKSLGEVGVLTNQDIQRMLQGGFPSDYDTEISRQAKREGILSDLQDKLQKVNQTLGVTVPSPSLGVPTVSPDAIRAELKRRGLLP